MAILIVLVDRGNGDGASSTEKSLVFLFLKSLKLKVHHHEDAIFVHHLRKTSSSKADCFLD
jgi:hypothetical protein